MSNLSYRKEIKKKSRKRKKGMQIIKGCSIKVCFPQITPSFTNWLTWLATFWQLMAVPVSSWKYKIAKWECTPFLLIMAAFLFDNFELTITSVQDKEWEPINYTHNEVKVWNWNWFVLEGFFMKRDFEMMKCCNVWKNTQITSFFSTRRRKGVGVLAVCSTAGMYCTANLAPRTDVSTKKG